jgi:hypothetical protein
MSGQESSLAAESGEVAAALEAIRSAVRRNAGYSTAEEVPAASSSSTMITELSDLGVISAHLPVTWNTPVVGRTLALAKRGTRLMLRWYINPIIEQQNAFNEALVRALASLDERQREIERRLAQDDQPA